MRRTDSQIIDILNTSGIFGPGSKELDQHERHLIRYFEREYDQLISNPVTSGSIGISSDQGPQMEDTEELMHRHYDESSEFFFSFLDNKYHAYSMAYYGDTAETIRRSKVTLEKAQYAKFSLIAERAQIEGNERILNIGCGFGSLEIFLLQEYPDIEVVGITPSKVQIESIRGRMTDSSNLLYGNNFNLYEGTLESYGNQKCNANKFDLIISIGVMEHVLNMSSILEQINSLLVEDGKTFHHFITSTLPIPKFLSPKNTKIGKYFPGGRAWPVSELFRHQQHLTIDKHWFINGMNYWRTLDDWHHRYWSNIPHLYGTKFDKKKIQHWNEYFALCKAVFAPKNGEFYGNSQYLLRKAS